MKLMQLVYMLKGWLPARLAGFAGDRRGVSTVEYAIMIVAVIGVVGAGAVVMGDGFDTLFESLSTEISTAGNPNPD